jgi:uncharacterized Ntn-hydrolase superfamily protein
MTYSIVARDPASGGLGVAVQTCMFGVGAIVPWARAGVGAVATQAFAEAAYGPRCLDLLAAGASAPAALAAVQEADPAAFVRQVGVVGADGSAAAVTGDWCIDHAGHLVGDGFTVQANMMAGPDVWPAMADAFVSSPAPFAHRLVAALEAAQDAGGDARGVMSAALVVVDAAPSEPWAGRQFDLRVDRSADPIGDLRELLRAAEAYAGYHHAVDAVAAGDAGRALAEIDRALSVLPGEENMVFVRAGALAATGDVDGAREALRALVAARPSWETIVRGFAAKGLLALPPLTSVDDLLP